MNKKCVLIDLVGQVYGSYTVMGRDYDSDQARKNMNVTRYWCRCSCGKLNSVNASTLRRGGSRGCLECGGKKQQKNAAGDIPTTLWDRIKDNAQRRGHEVLVSAEDAWNKYVEQDGKCALSGAPIGFRDGRSKNGIVIHTASLDRINSHVGYIVNNIQWVHKTVNLMKNDLDETEFFAFCLVIVEHFQTKITNQIGTL